MFVRQLAILMQFPCVANYLCFLAYKIFNRGFFRYEKLF